MKFIKKLIKNIFFLFNYIIIKKYYYDFDKDTSIKKILNYSKRNKKIIIFDVGANIGQSVERFRKYLPSALIFSFEPNPDCYKILKKRNDKKFKCFNVGLGLLNNNLLFFKQPDSGSSSFEKLKTNSNDFILSNTTEALKDTNKTTLKDNNIIYNTPIFVPVRTLKSITKEYKINYIDILKIDTQGSENKVLYGAGEILKKTLIIELEVILGNIYNNSTFGEIVNFLEKLNFVLWEIPYIKKFVTKKINRIHSIDVQFVNQKFLNKIWP
jgi:FkbM family methyltransferase